MLKKLMLTTAIGALMIGGAMAQTSAPSSSGASSTPSTTAALPVNQQKPDQWLASKFNGTDVIGDDNQKIGDVTDILFDKSGKIEAYIVSVGGFLGIGSKNVALPPSSFQVMPGDQTGGTSYDRLKLSMTKDQLQQMASFEPYSPPRQTTGQGSGLGGSSGGMATRPSTNTPPASAK
jgi:sporulation protein YlmC with PRC-barrel domain